MAFVAGVSVPMTANVPIRLPYASDASGNNPSFNLYSHMRVPGGGPYTFDTGQVLSVATGIDAVVAIPINATTVASAAVCTVQFGRDR